MTPKNTPALSPPVAGTLAGAVPRRQPLEHDALDVLVGAGGEKVGGVRSLEAGEDGAGASQVELLEGGSPVGVGLVDEEVAVGSGRRPRRRGVLRAAAFPGLSTEGTGLGDRFRRQLSSQ